MGLVALPIQAMRRNIYIPLFIAMAASFVPVRLDLGLSTYTIPVICIAYGATHMLSHAEWSMSFWIFGHLALYLAVFYACGRLVLSISTLPLSRSIGIAIQLLALLAIFFCSFVRVITYESLGGAGGTYTFWGAAARFVEQHKHQ